MRRLIIPLLLIVCSAAYSQNYNALNGPFGGGAEKIVKFSSGRLLAMKSGAGLFKSDDAAATWTKSTSGLPNNSFYDIIVDNSNKGYLLYWDRVYTSQDEGNTWVLTANSGFSGGKFIRQGPSGNYFIVSELEARVYRSATGSQWIERYQFPSGGAIVTDFEIMANGTLVIATYGQGIFKSGENDLSAVNVKGAGSISGDYVVDLQIHNNEIYALTADGPNRSTNSASSFTLVASASMPCCFYDEKMTSDGTNLYVTRGATIYKTNNNGSSWTTVPGPAINNSGYSYRAFAFTDASTGYVAVAGVSIFKTTNGGANWTAADKGFTGLGTNGLVFTDNNRLILTRPEGYGLYITLDDGATWDFMGTNNLARQINGVRKVGSTLIGYGKGIVKSTDNGGTWTVVNDGGTDTPYLYYIYNLATVDGVTMYTIDGYDYSSGTYNFGLWKSTNGGTNFTRTIISGLPSPTTSYIYDHKNVILDDNGNLWVLMIAAGVTEIYKINPATAAATKITNLATTFIRDLDYKNGKLYAVLDNSRLNYTSDGGDTWTEKTITGLYGNVKVIDDNTIYLLTSFLNLSTDGGESWFSTGAVNPGSSTYVQDVVVSSANYSYAAAPYSVVYKSKDQVVPPAAPSGLTILANGPKNVALQWNDNSNNESSFLIEFSKDDNLHYDTATFATRDNDFTRAEGFSYVNNLTPGAKYYFRVRAVGSGGKSAASNEVSITLPADCMANSTIPLNRSWTVTSLNLSGTNVPPALNETIEQYPATPGRLHLSNLPIGVGTGLVPYEPIEAVGATIIDNCNSVYLETDDYAGTEWIPNGQATWDPVAKTITIPIKTHPLYALRSETIVYTVNATDPVPPAPTNLKAGVYTSSATLIGWIQSTFVVSYEVERSTNASSGFVNIATVDAFSLSYKDTDPSLVSGTTYYYRVRAVNASGASPYSPTASVTASGSPLFAPFNTLPSKTFFTSSTGGAWADVDGDGIEDLVIGAANDSLNALMAPVVFKSKGDGSFTKFDIPELQSEKTGDYRGISVIDVNNDGRNDLYFNRLEHKDFLLIKNANGTYTKKMMPYPLSLGLGNGVWVDIDKDNDLDVIRAQDIIDTPDIVIYKNDGQGNLTAVTDSEIVTASNGSTRDVAFADYDNDGLLDVLKLNRISSRRSVLFHNEGGGNFKAVIGSAFESVNAGHRTATWGDYNNDGFLDVFVTTTSLAAPDNVNRLFKNKGDGTFENVAGPYNEQVATYGAGWADIDNDGDLDLLVTCDAGNRIFINKGDGTFVKSTSVELFTNANLGKLYGLAFADVDNDGFVDFYNGGFSGQNIPNFVYRNTLTPSSSRNYLKVKLTSNISNRSVVGARIRLIHNGKTQIREVSAHSAHGTQSSSIQHFGLGSSSSASLTITWPSGNVTTFTATSVNKTIVIPEDITAPVFTTLSPAHGSTESNVTKLEITLDEEAFPIPDKKISVAITGSGVISINATSGSKDGLKYTYTLPQKLTANTEYKVSIEQGAFEDLYGNKSAALSGATNWTFQTGDDPDAGPPVITFDPTRVEVFQKGLSAVNVPILVTDDKGVTGVFFRHRRIGVAEFENVSLGDSPTSFDVVAHMLDDMGMEYYIEATDAAGNIARKPTGANSYYRITVRFPDDLSPVIDVPSAGTSESWKLIAIPYVLPGTSSQTSEMFRDLGSASKSTWRLLRYNKTPTGPEWIAYPNITSIERGKGYFLNSLLVGKHIQLVGATTPSETRNDLFKMDLVQGWNQIGNPYTLPVDWNNVRSFSGAGTIVKELYQYTNGQYVKNQTLLAGVGGFVFATEAVNDLPIPLPGQTAPDRIKAPNFGPLDSDTWKVDITLNNGTFTSPTGGVGMSPDSEISYDQHDDFNPPRFNEYLEMNFSHPEFFYKLFGRDMVKTTGEYVWEFEVETNLDGFTSLSWDNSTFGNNTRQLYLYDIETQTPIDMRAANSYSFDPKVGRRFKVYYGEDVFSRIKPEKALLGAAFPNPASGFTTIPFSLPEKTGTLAVRLEVFDMLGRKVATLLQGEMKPGFYKADWLPGDEANSNGFYIYRLTVENGAAGEVLSGKILLKR